MKKNIILIGMPGSGKSTVGVVLAKMLGMNFLDTDILIQQREKKMLQEIINEVGNEGFLKVEDDVLKSVKVENTVIAPGGSVIYSVDGVKNLKNNGIMIYLDLNPDLLMERLSNLKTRGVTLKPGQTIKNLWEERHPLYKKYSDFCITTDKLSVDETITQILKLIEK